MPETKRVLWVDEQAGELLPLFKALVEKQCADRGIDLSFDFILAGNVEDGLSLADKPFDLLILEIVLPRDKASADELENIQLRREEIRNQMGLERLDEVLKELEPATANELGLVSRFRYLGEERDEYYNYLGGFRILKRWRKNFPAIVLSTQSLRSREVRELFSTHKPERWAWFEKPCELKEVVEALIELFQL